MSLSQSPQEQKRDDFCTNAGADLIENGFEIDGVRFWYTSSCPNRAGRKDSERHDFTFKIGKLAETVKQSGDFRPYTLLHGRPDEDGLIVSVGRYFLQKTTDILHEAEAKPNKCVRADRYSWQPSEIFFFELKHQLHSTAAEYQGTDR